MTGESLHRQLTERERAMVIGTAPIPRCYVATVYGGRDYRARDDLLTLGIDTWLPECRVRRTARRAIITIKGPLFPGYLFLTTVMTDERWNTIMGVREVSGILGPRGIPCAVDGELIAYLRRLVTESGGHVLIERGQVRRGYTPQTEAPKMKKGAHIRVTAGAYIGFEGIYEMPDADDRVKVFLDIFKRRTLVSLDEALVEPA